MSDSQKVHCSARVEGMGWGPRHRGREARMQKCMGLMWSGKTWVEQRGRCAGDLKRGFCTSRKQIRSMMQDMVMCMWLTNRKAKIKVQSGTRR